MVIDPHSMAILGGAIALAGGAAGSAMGIAQAASAGVAILADEPGQLRNVIVLASLPMTQTFYGLIVLILVLTSVADTAAGLGAGAGFAVFGCCVVAAFAEAFSGAYQGSVCASGISLLSKTQGKILTNGLMLAVFVELIGVLGLVFTIMSWSLLGLM